MMVTLFKCSCQMIMTFPIPRFGRACDYASAMVCTEHCLVYSKLAALYTVMNN